MRLREPNAKEKRWFNEARNVHGPDFFELPGYHADHYEFLNGRAIYPPDGASLNHQRVKLIQKHGNPHDLVWVRRIDLFFISAEIGDTERCFTINLANVDRRMHILAESMVAKKLPEGATTEGQAHWLMAYEIACDLLYTLDADMIWVSQFLQNIATNELDLEEPVKANDPIFTRENLLEGIREKKWFPFTPSERKFYQEQTLLTEHPDFPSIFLNNYGFLE